MKIQGRLVPLCVALVVAGSAGLAFADHHELTPIPEVPYAVPHVDAPYGTIYSEPIGPLFRNVKYKDRDEMAPCAVTKIIKVKDPCACEDACHCCGPKCVYIEICVPPCACERVKCRKDGDRVEYDYGEYSVDVRVKDGYIEVDYQD